MVILHVTVSTWNYVSQHAFAFGKFTIIRFVRLKFVIDYRFPSLADRQMNVIWAQPKMEHLNFAKKQKIQQHNGNIKIENNKICNARQSIVEPILKRKERNQREPE